MTVDMSAFAPSAGDHPQLAALLLQLADSLRELEEPRAIKHAAARFLGETVKATRAGYGEIVDEGESMLLEDDWVCGVPSLTGKFGLVYSFGAELGADLRSGKRIVVSDCDADERLDGPTVEKTWARFQASAAVAVPLMRQGELTAFLYLHHSAPRLWQEWEIALAEGVAARTWEAVARARDSKELQYHRERLQAVIDAMPALISYFDRDQRFQFVNQPYAEWFGQPLEAIRGRRLVDVMGAQMYEARRPFIERALAGESVTYVVEFSGSQSRTTQVQHVPDRDESGAVRGVYSLVQDITEQKVTEVALLEETRALEIRNRIGAALAAELDPERLIQLITDLSVEAVGAKFGAFFHRVSASNGDDMMLYTLSGAKRSDFDHFGMPRATMIFQPTFQDMEVVRSEDILVDPRYGKNAPHSGMPEGHLPVRSYLAVPVQGRAGESIGGLFFGHPEPGRFLQRHEVIIQGIATKAAIALENARLFEQAQTEIAQRKVAEEHLRLLVNELNHRVKNTLAIVQGLAQQTFREQVGKSPEMLAFQGRLTALAGAHDVLTGKHWESVRLSDIVGKALGPFHGPQSDRLTVAGPDVELAPQNAVSFAMALHELATNAVKYGAWSNEEGHVDVCWTITGDEPGKRLAVKWKEIGGPRVTTPSKRGFGSRMIEKALSSELSGEASIRFEEAGLVCEISAPLQLRSRDAGERAH